MSDALSHPQQSFSPPLGEFELIRAIFKARADEMIQTNPINAPRLGIGDDCAIIGLGGSEDLAITSDLLVSDRHFFSDADPYQLGHKALAVNLSDLAAMGAKPLGFMLSLALPAVKRDWLNSFANGLFDLARPFNCHLLGGDTCRGPLAISITALGQLPPNCAIKRSGAKVGDEIWVSGTVGDARLALGELRSEWQAQLDPNDLTLIHQRLHTPIPRIELGLALRGIASAALDISDGLLGDLQHILDASQVSAQVNMDSLPRSTALKKQSPSIQTLCAASGGDDYELCFTASPAEHANLMALAKKLALPITCIGHITHQTAGVPIVLIDETGNTFSAAETQHLLRSFDHFKN
jgi:thiamine-monophosphate kinase